MSLKNRFGWSLSRESLFDSCRKRYFFHYYLSWNGWNNQAEEIRREAFLLKRLISLPLWRGQLVHYITSKVLQSTRRKGRIPPENRVLEYAEERFEKQFQFSRQKRYLNIPKKRRGKLNIDWLALFDHEYCLDIPARRLETVRAEVRESLRNLLQSGILQRASLSETSEWLIEDIDMSEFAQSFYLRGVRIFVKTDFIYRSPDGVLNIIDWKTFRKPAGKDNGDRDQLGVYGYYAASEMKEPPDNVRLTEVNLLDSAAEKTFCLNEELVAGSEERIEKGIKKLCSVLTGSDPDRNESASPEHFPANPGTQCRTCNFKRICRDASGPS